ncbi:hypothetical protein MN0502_05490 [Arthrobacter sp. MN05-02]|nr:hypothetical protein MN0502_05490 [Arthrobacter sp. MN05-02]
MNTLVQYGFTDRIDGLFSAFAPLAGASPTRVIRADRGRMLLARPQGILHLDSVGGFVTGDWVGVRDDGEYPAVVGALPRWSTLQRKRAFDLSSRAQVLGANIDLVGVVVPLDRPLSTNRLERTLVAAWDSGAVPIVILTKADLSTRFDDVVADTIARVRGVEVLTTSAEACDGLEELHARIGTGQTPRPSRAVRCREVEPDQRPHRRGPAGHGSGAGGRRPGQAHDDGAGAGSAR